MTQTILTELKKHNALILNKLENQGKMDDYHQF